MFDSLCTPTISAKTSNHKYTSPFTPDTTDVKIYGLNNIKLNSPMYYQHNQFPETKSYGTIITSYQHYLTKLLEKKKQELADEQSKLVTK